MPDLNDDLIQAYRETHYVVGTGPTCFTLRIGVPNAILRARNRHVMFRQGIFITACNPQSDLTSAEANADAQASLRGNLSWMKVKVTDAVAVDPQELFPDEPGFFVEGASKEDGLYLALRYRQHGFVWVDFDDVPQLVLLRQTVERSRIQGALDCIVQDYNGKKAPLAKRDHLGRPQPIWSHDRKGECEAFEEVLSEFQGSETWIFLNWIHNRCFSVEDMKAAVSAEYVCRYEDELAILKKVKRELLALFIIDDSGARFASDAKHEMEVAITQILEASAKINRNSTTGLFDNSAFQADAAWGWPGILELKIDDLNEVRNDMGRCQADSGLIAPLGAALLKLQGDASQVRVYSRYYPENFALRFADISRTEELFVAFAQAVKLAVQDLVLTDDEGRAYSQEKLRSLKVVIEPLH